MVLYHEEATPIRDLRNEMRVIVVVTGIDVTESVVTKINQRLRRVTSVDTD